MTLGLRNILVIKNSIDFLIKSLHINCTCGLGDSMLTKPITLISELLVDNNHSTT